MKNRLMGYNIASNRVQISGDGMLRGLLDPKIDFVFKNIFGSAKHPDILMK